MTTEEIRDHAEALILDHATDAGVDDPNDDHARAIHDEIRRAQITVTFPAVGVPA